MNQRPLTLRRRVAVAFAGTAVLGLIALAFTTGTFADSLTDRRRVVNRLDPAVVAGRDLTAALVDQETGVRGYTLTAEEPFLEPYDRGRRAEIVAARRLDALIGGEPRLSDAVSEALLRADEWRDTSADPLVAAVRTGGVRAVTPEVLEESRSRFETFREAAEALEDALAAEREQALGNLDVATRRLSASFAGAVIAAVLAGAGIWIALRRWIIAPLDQLGAQTRAVTAGDFRRPIESAGPPELADLGRDIEEMRRRILTELAAVEEARALLDAQAEELARSNRDLEQFAYVASHDLQEPLRKVASFCQLLERRYVGQLDERADQYIGFAVDGAKRMQMLINDLLAFSRVGRTTEGFVPVDCNEALHHAVGNLEEAVEAAGATVRAGDLPTVNGDPSLLTALFQNLIGNALKFRSEAPPVVEISAEVADDEWSFRVADNGIGIDPAYTERVFVIFQRLHGKEEYPGTGIGLALCKKIVEFHGGHIWIDEASAPGTTVRWTLPVRSGAAAGAPGEPNPDVPADITPDLGAEGVTVD